MTRLLIQDLLPNTAYAMQLRAVGPDNISEWSQRQTFSTITDVVNINIPASLTWVVTGNSFHGEWNAVTTNVNGDTVAITRYEVELVAGGTTKIDSVTAATGSSKVTYDLSFESNVALFGSPKPQVQIRVRAVDNKELKSDWTSPVTATNPAPDTPTAPAVGAVATAGTDSISLAWTAPADDDLIGYNVYVGATAGFAPSSANRIYSGMANRFTYVTTTYSVQYFKIKSVDVFGQESTTGLTGNATANSAFTFDATAPNTPTGLTASITNAANGLSALADVSWTLSSPPSDLAGFTLRYRKTGSSGNYTLQSYDKNTTSAQVTGLDAYTNYDFAVSAYDWGQNYSSYTAAVTATSPSNAAPANVTGLSAVPGRDSITYSWNAVADTDIKNYEVTFSTSATFASGNITFLTGTATTLTVGGLTPSTTYYARVRAVDNGGLNSVSWSSTNTTATTAFPTTPLSDGSPPASSPTPTVSSGIGYLFVNWTAVANADIVTYEVHVSTTTGFTPSGATKAGETTSTFAVLEKDGAGTALAYGTTYYVKLIAKDRDGAAAAGAQGSGQVAKVAAADSSLTAGDVGAPTLAALASTDANVSSLQTGKNKITYSTSTPGSTANVAGDIWFQTSGATIIGQWQGNGGTSWTQVTITNTVIANLDAGKINTGFLDVANRIQANSINASKISIADFNNYAYDGSFLYTGAWDGVSVITVDGTNPNYATLTKTGAGNRDSYGSNWFDTVDGDSYYISFEVYRPSTNPSTAVAAGERPGVGVAVQTPTGAPNWFNVFLPAATVDANATDTWWPVAGNITVSAGGYVRGKPWITINGTTASNNTYRFRKIKIFRRNGGELIVDGSITATKMTANTITAASGIIADAAITDAKIVTLTATKLTAGTISAQTIQVASTGSIQSTDYSTGSAGWKLSTGGLEINNGSVKASAIVAGTLGSSTGTINIAAGAILNVNGGYIKSNTYTGTSAASNPANAGFYLGNDGLRIDSGTITAAALVTGTISGTNTITLSGANAHIQGTGWDLSGTGLTITGGTISAAALQLQKGENLIPPQYADFEFVPTFYTTALTLSAGTFAMSSTSTINSQALSWSPTAGATIHLGSSVTNYNIPVASAPTATVDYIISYYARINTGGTTTNLTPSLKYATSTSPGTLNGTAQAIPANSTWARYSTVVTLPVTTPTGGAELFFTSSAATTVFIDGIQVEERWGALTTPSSWTPPSITTIDGGMIKTGSIRSSTDVTINSITYPAWNIDTSGAAQFSNLLIRGNTIVGADVAEGTGSMIRSYNYAAGATGWAIFADGTAEFRQLLSNSINGGAITSGTLDVEKLSGGKLGGDIQLLSDIYAAGLMGERVTMGADGFEVLGAYQVSITNAALTSNVATFTTATDHNYLVGNKVVVSGLANAVYNGTFTVASIPTSTTFTVAITNANIGSAAAQGLAQGFDTAGLNLRPTLISFPTDGTRPNIISGTLSADTLVVSVGAALSGASSVTQGSVLGLEGQVIAPKSAPTVTAVWGNKFTLNPPWVSYSLSGFALGPDGKYYQPVTNIGTPNWNGIGRYDTSGNYETSFINATTPSGHTYRYKSVVYSSTYNVWWVLKEDWNGSTNLLTPIVETWNSTFSTMLNSYSLPTYTYLVDCHILGMAYDTNQPMWAYWGEATPSQSVTARSLTVNGSGYVTGYDTAVTLANTATDVNGNPDRGSTGFIARGNFDIGATRIIWRSGYHNTSSLMTTRFMVFNTSGVQQSAENWLGVTAGVLGGYWNTTTSQFEILHDNQVKYNYYGGESYWTTGLAANRTMQFKYALHNVASGATTLPSPAATVTFNKRQNIKVSINPIQTGTGGPNNPDSAYVYSTIPYDTTPGSVWQRGTIISPSTVFYTSPTQTYSGITAPVGSEGFPFGVSGKIVGLNGMEINADGTITGVTLKQTDDVAPTAPTFTNGWVNKGGVDHVVKYGKRNGMVYCQGTIASGTLGSAAFTLPTGMRPTNTLNFAQMSSGAVLARVTVSSSGNVTPTDGSTTWLTVNFSFQPSI